LQKYKRILSFPAGQAIINFYLYFAKNLGIIKIKVILANKNNLLHCLEKADVVFYALFSKYLSIYS
jgi:hypothetical protein